MADPDIPSVSFPTNERTATGAGSSAVQARSQTDVPSAPRKAAISQRTLGAGPVKHGSRSTSFAMINEPHMSAIPSPLGPGTSQRRRVVTHSPAIPSRKGKEPESSTFTGDTFAVPGAGQYSGPEDPQLLQDVSRLLAQGAANRTRTKSSAIPTPAGSPKVATPATPSRPSRAYTTSIPTSPITPSRSATSSLKSPLTSPSKRHTLPAVPPPPHRSTEALVTHDPPLPPPSTSKCPLDWSAQQPEEVAPQRRRRRFSLTRRPKKDQQTGSDTGGEDADALEASFKAVRDMASPGAYRRRDAVKQELEARYSFLQRFVTDYKRPLNPAEIVRWRRRNAPSTSLTGIVSTTSLPSFAAAASDPNILMTLDNDPRHRFRLNSTIIQEWYEAEVIPPAAADMAISSSVGSTSTVRGDSSIGRKRGATVTLGSSPPAPDLPPGIQRRQHRLSQPVASLESLKGSLSLMMHSAARKEAVDSNSSLSKVKRALRLQTTSRPTSAGNSEEESGASAHRKIIGSRPHTPDLPARGDSGTDDDARSGRSFGHIARKSMGLLGMTGRDDAQRRAEMSPSLLSPMTSTDAMSKTLEGPPTARSPYLHIKQWQPGGRDSADMSKTSGEEQAEAMLNLLLQARESELRHLERERRQTHTFLTSVTDSLKEYQQLQHLYGDIIGGGSPALSDAVLRAIDKNPYELDKRRRLALKSQATYKVSEEIQTQIDSQRRILGGFFRDRRRLFSATPSTALQDGLELLVNIVGDLQAQQRDASVVGQKLQDLQPRIETLWEELRCEVDETELIVGRSYGVRTRTTALANSAIHSVIGWVAEFLLTRAMSMLRQVKRNWQMLAASLLAAVLCFILWMRLNFMTALFWTAAAVVGTVGGVLAVMLGHFFLWRDGYTNSPSLAS